MRSHKVTPSFPYPIWDAIGTHAPEVTCEWPIQLFTLSLLHALIVQNPHVITATIASASEKGESKRCSYLGVDVKRFGINAIPEVFWAAVADEVKHRREKEA